MKKVARKRELPNIREEETDENNDVKQKTLFQHPVTAGIATQFDLMMTMDERNLLLFQEYSNSRSYPTTRALAAGTTVGPVLDVHIVKNHDGYATEVAIHSICRHKDTCYFSEVRSSNELPKNLQESLRNELYEERKVTTRSNETWAAPRPYSEKGILIHKENHSYE